MIKMLAKACGLIGLMIGFANIRIVQSKCGCDCWEAEIDPDDDPDRCYYKHLGRTDSPLKDDLDAFYSASTQNETVFDDQKVEVCKECAADRVNFYTWPADRKTDSGNQLYMVKEQNADGKLRMNFHAFWKAPWNDDTTWDPFLLIMTHEDVNRKVYGSVSTMIRSTEGSVGANDAEALKGGYMQKFCNSVFPGSWSLESSPTNPISGFYTFGGSDEEYDLNTLEYNEDNSGTAANDNGFPTAATNNGFLDCITPSAQNTEFTLKISSPEVLVLDNTLDDSAFSYDPSDNELSISSVNNYTLEDGTEYKGDVVFDLCADSDCFTVFTLLYGGCEITSPNIDDKTHVLDLSS